MSLPLRVCACSLLLFIYAHAVAAQAPSTILPDIVNFKITYPLDDEGEDYTGVAYDDRDDPHIKSEEALDLNGYVAPVPYRDYFYVDGNEVVFRAHCAGALTSVNAYPRSELRERVNGGNDLWRFADEHELNATFRITHLPDQKREVCVLQIKGNTSNSTSNTEEALRLEYREGNNRRLHLVVNEDDVISDVMAYTVGETIAARLYVNAGQITVELTNLSTGGTYSHQYMSNYDWGYFKAGCYTQSSIWEEKNGVADELPTAYGEVRFSELVLGVLPTLPVALSDFTGAYNEETAAVNLRWTTAGERRNAGFHVERSRGADAAFSRIGWVPGRGDTREEQDYTFPDEEVEKGRTYHYRLVQEDLDESLTQSRVITVASPLPGGRLRVYPNPASDRLTVRAVGCTEDGTFSLVDARGRIVRSGSLSAHNGYSCVVDTRGLPGGAYGLVRSGGVGELVVIRR